MTNEFVGLNHIEGLDRAFLVRTLRTTLVLGTVLTTWLIQTLQIPLLGGFAAGVLLGVAGLALTMWAADQAQSKSRASTWRVYIPAVVMVSKAALLYLALRLLIWRWAFSPLALAAGASLVMVVIVLKVIGRTVQDKFGAPAATAGRR